jgi:hypothetical protein
MRPAAGLCVWGQPRSQYCNREHSRVNGASHRGAVDSRAERRTVLTAWIRRCLAPIDLPPRVFRAAEDQAEGSMGRGMGTVSSRTRMFRGPTSRVDVEHAVGRDWSMRSNADRFLVGKKTEKKQDRRLCDDPVGQRGQGQTHQTAPGLVGPLWVSGTIASCATRLHLRPTTLKLHGRGASVRP